MTAGATFATSVNDIDNAVIVAIIAAVPGTLAALVGILGAWKSSIAAKKATSVHAAVLIIEQQTNSMHDAVVRLTGAQQRAEGKAEGLAEAMAEKGRPALPGGPV